MYFPQTQNLKITLFLEINLSGELFLYNIKDRSVLISPFGLIKGGLSNVKIFDEIKDTVIASTVSRRNSSNYPIKVVF